jgi:hypothetical protein
MENTEDIKEQIQAAELYNAMYNQQPQDPSLLPNQKCDKCQHTIFDNKYIIKKVKQSVNIPVIRKWRYKNKRGCLKNV